MKKTLRERIIRRLGGVPLGIMFPPVRKWFLVPFRSSVENGPAGIRVNVEFIAIDRKKEGVYEPAHDYREPGA